MTDHIPITIKPVELTEDAFSTNFSLEISAFGPSPIGALAFGGVKATPHERAQKDLARIQKNASSYMLHNAVDATGEVLGFAKWYIVRDPHAVHYPRGNPAEIGAGLNEKLYDDVFGEMRRRREKIFRDKNEDYAYMMVLVVDPKAQRRGVGSALLREGLREVDRLGLESFIDASPEGLELYKKFDWAEVTEVTVDLAAYGGEGMSTTVGLVRPKAGVAEGL